MKVREIKKLLGKKYFDLYTQFIRKKVPEPFQSFKIIYEEALKRSKGKEKFQMTKKVFLISNMIRMRTHHYPLQYLCSSWPFMSLQLKLQPPILIPRFETEQMLAILFENERFLKRIEEIKEKGGQFRFLELGCGSGAIGLALGKYLDENGVKYKGKMIDIDQRAIKLSRKNAQLNNLNNNNLEIAQQDMLQQLDEKGSQYFLDYNLIISNPPYISYKQYTQTLQSQVKHYQSKLALIGDPTLNFSGLYYIEKIIRTVLRLQEQSRPFVVLEYGGEDLGYLGKEVEESVSEDYYGKRRFVFLMGIKRDESQVFR